MDDEAVSLLVDEIGDVYEVEERLLNDPLRLSKAWPVTSVRGVYKLKDRLLLVLDTEKVVQVAA